MKKKIQKRIPLSNKQIPLSNKLNEIEEKITREFPLEFYESIYREIINTEIYSDWLETDDAKTFMEEAAGKDNAETQMKTIKTKNDFIIREKRNRLEHLKKYIKVE